MLFLNWTSSSDPGVPTKAEVAQGAHWNLWRTRQPPFKAFEEGSQVVLVDTWPTGGRMTWLVRAKDVVAGPYATKDEGVRLIARGLKIKRAEVRDHDYTTGRPDAGYVLAWNYVPLKRLDLPRPPGMRFQQNGWLSVDDPSVLKGWGLDAATPTPTPMTKTLPSGQGRLKLEERLAVETRAMVLAADWCRQNGWPLVTDVSTTRSWDLEARQKTTSAPVFVEVKGTTGPKRVVEVTSGEVKHAQANPDRTVLVIVTDIRLKKGDMPVASGGKLSVIHPWSPEATALKPTRYRWSPD